MSDIYINGESLRVDKKFDSVLIEGIDEVVNSLRPKIVMTGGGGSPTPTFNKLVAISECVSEVVNFKLPDITVSYSTRYATSAEVNS